jgi:hypothetical protein
VLVRKGYVLLGSDHPSASRKRAGASESSLEGRASRQLDRIADRGLELGRRVLGPDDPALTGLLRRKAASLRFLGRFTEAAARRTTTRCEFSNVPCAPNHPDLALTRVHAAVNLIRLSEYERGSACSSRRFPRIRLELGAETIDYARALTAEGEYRVHMGDVGRARALLEESLALHRRLGTDGFQELARLFARSERCFSGTGWPQEGERCFEEALTTYERIYPPHHVEVGIAKHQMANALHVTGEFRSRGSNGARGSRGVSARSGLRRRPKAIA